MTNNLPEAKKLSNQKTDPVAFLYERGAHFVLCRENKKPIWSLGWKNLRARPDTCRAHDGPLGIVPYSIKTTALDVDEGDPKVLLNEYPALASIASRRLGGLHLYYGDDKPRGNKNFSLHGCSGQVRGAKGYLILWDNAADILADALSSPARTSSPFPATLFEAAGIEEPSPSYKPSTRRPDDPLRLEKALPGIRHHALFDEVRFWAYQQVKGADLNAWKRRVRAYAINENNRFPVPFGDHRGDTGKEPDVLAYSVATWIWSGGGPINHSTDAQRRRGVKSGKVRRASVADKDALVVAAFEGGSSIHVIAQMDGRGRWAIRNVLRREIPLVYATRGGESTRRKREAKVPPEGGGQRT